MIDAARDRYEANQYKASQLAFWLRPDRDDYDMPCWMIDGDYANKPILKGFSIRNLMPNEKVYPDLCYSNKYNISPVDGVVT